MQVVASRTRVHGISRTVRVVPLDRVVSGVSANTLLQGVHPGQMHRRNGSDSSA